MIRGQDTRVNSPEDPLYTLIQRMLKDLLKTRCHVFQHYQLGKRRFGTYRFLPFFFCLGGVMEWIMINVRIGRETFYDVYRRKRSEREYQQKIDDGLIVPGEMATK